jgi:hypothetical protein
MQDCIELASEVSLKSKNQPLLLYASTVTNILYGLLDGHRGYAESACWCSQRLHQQRFVRVPVSLNLVLDPFINPRFLHFQDDNCGTRTIDCFVSAPARYFFADFVQNGTI